MNVNAELESFSYNMKFIRRKLGLTQKEMANKLNISTYSIRKIEKGVISKHLKVDILLDIYSVFGIKPSEMFILMK